MNKLNSINFIILFLAILVLSGCSDKQTEDSPVVVKEYPCESGDVPTEYKNTYHDHAYSCTCYSPINNTYSFNMTPLNTNGVEPRINQSDKINMILRSNSKWLCFCNRNYTVQEDYKYLPIGGEFCRKNQAITYASRNISIIDTEEFIFGN